MSAQLSIHEVLTRLSGVRQSGDNWMACCPAHDDKTSSLSLTIGREGHILFRCFAGCELRAILDALKLTINDVSAPKEPKTPRREVATYDYRDLDGSLRFQVVRFEPKDFRQRRPDGNGGWIWDMRGISRIPYRLHELKDQKIIFVTEGEKDADLLWKLGRPATTNAGGAGKWRDSESDILRAAGVQKCVLLPDNDIPGRKHMADVEASLKAAGLAVVRLDLAEVPIKGDISDWFRAGHTLAELDALVSKKPYVMPKGIEKDPDPIDPEHDPTRWHKSDLGAAEAFVHRVGDEIRYDHARERWLIWDQHIWRPDADSAIYRLAHDHIRSWQSEAMRVIPQKSEREQWIDFLMKSEQRARIENFVTVAKRIKPVSDSGEAWDKNGWLFSVANGVVDLRTGELRNGRREDRLTLQSDTPFLLHATCPSWLKFLEETFEGNAELIAYLQRALGYTLTGDMREQCFWMCVGVGSNGKSTFLSTLDTVFGTYAYTADMKMFTTNQGTDQDFGLAELANRRLILASETKSDSRLNEQVLKNFTGGEKINAQRKYGHPFEYIPTGKIWVGVNHQPRVKDDSYGFWRRVRIIKFNKVFAGSASNPNLRHELACEAPGILNWAIQGCLDWQRDGLNQPVSVFNATSAYQDSEDPIQEFLLDRTEPDSEADVSAVGIYHAYREWALENGLSDREKLTATSFGRMISRRFERHRTSQGQRYRGVRVTVPAKNLFHGQE